MRHVFFFFAITLLFPVYGCDKGNPGAVDLTIIFSWEGMKPYGWGNPEISIGDVPEETTDLIINMFDHAYNHDHGTVKVPYTGNGLIAKDRFREIQGPYPSWTPGRYAITVRAPDEKERVSGIGRHERPFPE